MAASPVFEVFEVICTELAAQPTQIISEDRLDDGLLEEVKEHFDETSAPIAFKKALEEVQAHFVERDGRLPFSVNLPTREFTTTDADFVEFVAFARNHRGVGGSDSRDFEIRTVNRLRKRLTGELRRVGTPRTRLKRKRELVGYLQKLGFDKNCLEKHDKDGGLDILWLPPLGAIPLRPIVSVQCKNSFFDEGQANESTGRAKRTLLRHSHLRDSHLKFVVFNDYIDTPTFRGKAAGWGFMPLGLTDLADLGGPALQDVL